MKLVHLADLHLGMRQFYRVTPSGLNQRESDVARAFTAAVDRLIAIAPEVVLFAGDIFHSPRPSNTAIVHAHDQFCRIRRELPNAVVVIVSGNHDAPKTGDTWNILELFQAIGVHVASGQAKRFQFPERSLSVLAVPEQHGVHPELEPDSSFKYNVLLVHGEIEHVVPNVTPGWDYVGFGHYHVHRSIAPRTFYAGALEYTSSNPWGEMAEQASAGVPGKGFVSFDLDAHAADFVPVDGSREFVQLPEITGAEQLTPEDLNAKIAAAVDACPGGIDGKIVRLIIRDVPKNGLRTLDHQALKKYRARALNFQLVTHRVVEHVFGTPDRPVRKRATLREIVAETLAKRPLPPDITLADIERVSAQYLDKADARDDEPAEPETAEATA